MQQILSPQTIINDGTLAGIAWLNPTNGIANDGNYTTSLFTITTFNSQYLKASNFGFSIPKNSIITGIKIDIEKSVISVGADVQDKTLQLLKADTISGNNKASANAWSTSDSVVSYGSDGDLWGLTLNPSDINDNTFGLVFSVQSILGLTINTCNIDYILITIYYKFLSFQEANILNNSFITGI